MSSYKKLHQKNDTAKNGGIEGQWFNIRMTPDLVTGEVFNLGVGYKDDEGQYHIKLLDNFSRISCIYDDRLSASDIKFMIGVVKDAIIQDPECLPSDISPNILFSDFKYASGSSIDSILDDLYFETVTLGRINEEKRYSGVDTDTARELVFAHMKTNNTWIDNLIHDSSWVITEGKNKHEIDMPLRGPKIFGNVISAWYRSLNNIRLHALAAENDMATARKLHPNDRAGLFLLCPPTGAPGISDHLHNQIENMIDKLEWQMKLQNVNVSVEASPERLANDVLEWADSA